MQIREPKNSNKYYWTRHVYDKMRQYSISEAVVKRVIRSPERTEEGIAPGTTAVMQSRGKKQKHEIWVMYQTTKTQKSPETQNQERIRIITTWRYPGISLKRKEVPIPHDILEELNLLMLHE